MRFSSSIGRRRSAVAWITIALVTAACGAAGGQRSAAGPESTSSLAPITSPAAGAVTTQSAGPSPVSATGGVELAQPWATAVLTNVRTGKPFRIADFSASGKVVFIETMAIWCTSCRAQQYEAVAAFERMDPSKVEWVAIDVERDESPAALAAYSVSNGFPFTYVVADVNLARALADAFGDVVLSPPSGNVIVIGTDGRITQTQRGHKNADELVALARANGA